MENKIKGLSLRAIGLFILMHKHPGITRETLLKDYKDGDFSLRSAYKELKKAGLIGMKFRGYYIIKKGKSEVLIEKTEKPAQRKTLQQMSIKDALEFYNKEFESAQGHPVEGKYWNFIEYLKGKNDTEEQLDHVLKLRKPLSFKQFVDARERARKADVKLGDILDGLANGSKYTKDRTSLYGIINKWIKLAAERKN